MSQAAASIWGPDEEIDDEEAYNQDALRKDALIIAIEATESMLAWAPKSREDASTGEPTQFSCCLLETIKVAYKLMRQKIISNPKDSIALMVFNTEVGSVTGTEVWKSCNFLQDLQPVDAPSIKKLKTLIEKCERDPKEVKRLFAPQTENPNEIPQALAACANRFMERCVKLASKRILWITDNTSPLSSSNTEHAQNITASTWRYQDIIEIKVKFQFAFYNVSTPFREGDFYWKLLSTRPKADDKSGSSSNPAESLTSLNMDLNSWSEKLLKDVSTRDNAKRSAFKIPFKIGEGMEIGINGFVLIVEQKRKAPILVDPHTSSNEQVKVVTEYLDADSTAVVEKKDIVNYFPIGDMKEIKTFRRVIFTNEEIEKMRTVGLDKGLTLLGFRPRDELLWAYHVKHAYYIYPNEDTFVGSTRAFSALLHSMAKKNKIGYGLLRSRKNDTPTLVAILPQLEDFDEASNTQMEPPGMHLCVLPWADDLNPPPTVNQLDCLKQDESSNHITELAEKIVRKLRVDYAGNKIHNPALQHHYDFLAAKYLNEKFEPAEDESLPWYPSIKERCGPLIKELIEEIDLDPRAAESVIPESSITKKRRRIEDGEGVDVEVVESAFASGKEKTLTVVLLKEYLIFKKELSIAVKAPLKAELLDMTRKFLAKQQNKSASGSTSTGTSRKKKT
ncbi:ATP-dependent DNA helicase II subunit 1 [Puccinia graminis f. sp. tritici]|uniref:ATP-dependent DNA helicase II subunit 1 n=1 Tax=Puccinia graminis f. sp. tritici TaxID=56615 RepID=A0A5B0PNY7_PUCGR|nr:ATP-dependent DNA helicase II subunit 1 [Puccinia graminis f. sp. tritici]